MTMDKHTFLETVRNEGLLGDRDVEAELDVVEELSEDGWPDWRSWLEIHNHIVLDERELTPDERRSALAYLRAGEAGPADADRLPESEVERLLSQPEGPAVVNEDWRPDPRAVYEFSMVFDWEKFGPLFPAAGFRRACTCCGKMIPWDQPTLGDSEDAEHDGEVIFHPDHWILLPMESQAREDWCFDMASLQAKTGAAHEWLKGYERGE
jgi:hypothetical protein